MYAGVKLGRALEEITEDMTLFKGVKLGQVLEAFYEQGRKDGRREIIERVDEQIGGIKDDKAVNWRNPGQPAKKAAAKKAAPAKKSPAKKATPAKKAP